MNRIREMRKKKGMSQETLGSFVGVSQQTISKIEKNSDEASVGLLIRIAEYFNVTTDYILGLSDEKRNLLREGKMNRKVDNYYDFIVEFEELNEDVQKILRVILRALKNM